MVTEELGEPLSHFSASIITFFATAATSSFPASTNACLSHSWPFGSPLCSGFFCISSYCLPFLHTIKQGI